MKTAKEVFENIVTEVKEELGDVKVFLYGPSLRNLILGKSPTSFDIFIESHTVSEPLLTILNNKNIRISYGRKFTYQNCFHTIDCVSTELTNIIQGIDDIKESQGATKDMGKGIIKLSKLGKTEIQSSPELILDTVMLVDSLGFHLDSTTINLIFQNKNIVRHLEKRKLFNFLKDISKANKPRKVISNLNTLGLSQVLFDMELAESSSLNHLRKNDSYEFLALIFQEIDESQIEAFLSERCGAMLREADSISILFRSVKAITGEDEENARQFFETVDKKRVPNGCRLLKALGYKELSKNIKIQKAISAKNKIKIKKEDIASVFGLTREQEIDYWFGVAVKKILNDPEYNNKAKILVYLNQERKMASPQTADTQPF